MKIKNLINCLLFTLAVLFLMGCDSYLTYDEGFKNISRHCFELKKDAFLVPTSERFYEYRVGFPGNEGRLPVSIEDYLQYPNGWWKTEAFIKRNPDSKDYFPHYLIVLKKGTIIYVDRIHKEKIPLGDTFIRIYGRVGVKGLKEKNINLKILFKRDYNNYIYVPDEQYISETSCPYQESLEHLYN